MTINTWNQCYLEGDTPWDRGEASPPLKQWVQRHGRLQGRALVPGCGGGHDVAMLTDAGLDVIGLDIAPLAIDRARQRHPNHAACFLEGDLFAMPADWRGSFDWVFEHTCLSGLPPGQRWAYRDAMASAVKSGGLLVGVWYINPDLDPGETGPPFPLPVPELDALFASGFEVVEDEVPTVAYPGREGRERLRVLRRLT